MTDNNAIPFPGATKSDDKPHLVPLLISLAKGTRALVGIKLAEQDFHNGQDELLVALNENAPISVSSVAEVLSVRPSTVSKMIDRLVARGLVQRIGNARDARKTMVQITPIGLDERSKLLKLREELEVELMASWPGEAEDNLQALESVEAVLKRRLARLR